MISAWINPYNEKVCNYNNLLFPFALIFITIIAESSSTTDGFFFIVHDDFREIIGERIAQIKNNMQQLTAPSDCARKSPSEENRPSEKRKQQICNVDRKENLKNSFIIQFVFGSPFRWSARSFSRRRSVWGWEPRDFILKRLIKLKEKSFLGNRINQLRDSFRRFSSLSSREALRECFCSCDENITAESRPLNASKLTKIVHHMEAKKTTNRSLLCERMNFPPHRKRTRTQRRTTK